VLESGDRYLTTVLELVRSMPAGQTVVRNPGDDEYLAVTRIEGPGWYFVTVYPRALLRQQVLTAVSAIPLFGIAFLVVALLIPYFTLRSQVIAPLEQFTSAAGRIASSPSSATAAG